MAGHKLLLPYNFTDYDKKALDFVVRIFAPLKDAEITLFNAYTPVPEIEMTESPVMEKLRGNLSYLSGQITEKEAALQEVQQILLAKGFSENRIHTIFKPRKKDIASEIIDLTMQNKFDIIFLNRKPGKITRILTGSTVSKIVRALKNTAICIIS